MNRRTKPRHCPRCQGVVFDGIVKQGSWLKIRCQHCQGDLVYLWGKLLPIENTKKEKL